MPPKPSRASGSIARRVQRTTPSEAGSPDATPSVNGSARNGVRLAGVHAMTGNAAATAAAFSAVRRLRWDTS